MAFRRLVSITVIIILLGILGGAGRQTVPADVPAAGAASGPTSWGQSAATDTCWSRDAAQSFRSSALGRTLFRYHQSVSWCSDGVKVTSFRCFAFAEAPGTSWSFIGNTTTGERMTLPGQRVGDARGLQECTASRMPANKAFRGELRLTSVGRFGCHVLMYSCGGREATIDMTLDAEGHYLTFLDSVPPELSPPNTGAKNNPWTAWKFVLVGALLLAAFSFVLYGKQQRLILGTFLLVVGLMFVLFGLNMTDVSTPATVVT